jgi:hypothetical protein
LLVYGPAYGLVCCLLIQDINRLRSND